ncbi:MAG: hypothetical protein HOO86_11635 [Bacteroidales bacterium]|nr:hypothetical protein [Bacteroidales bacterium]
MKRLVRCLLAILLVQVYSPLLAQDVTFFSTDSQVFIEQIDSLLLNTKNKTYIEKTQVLMNKLKEPWIQGRFNKEEKDFIKAIAGKIYVQKLPNHPDLYNYISVIQLLAESKQPPASTLAWLKNAFDLVQKKPLHSFFEMITFTERFLSHKELKAKNGASWAAHDAQFRFETDSTLMIRFEKLDLVCASQRDSSIILNTSGLFNCSTGLWNGKNGRVDWWRFGYQPEEFCVQLSNYKINLNQAEYFADSVVFEGRNKFSNRLLGRFSDKVMSSPPNQRTSYPRFTSYLDNHLIENIFPDIDFQGRISIEGGTIYGQGSESENASLTFRLDGEAIAILRSTRFVIGADKLASEKVKANFMVEKDSIYHPELKMRFSNASRLLLLFRSANGVGEAPFSDSYHKLDLYFEALNWNIDADILTFSKLEGVSQESKGWLQSVNYFSDSEYQFMKGIDDIHPMILIDKYLKTFGYKNTVHLGAFSDYIKKPSEQVLSQFLRLASKGLIVYDPETTIGIVTDQFFNVLSSRAGKTDYDVIKIQSSTTGHKPNISYEFRSKNMTVNGVSTVILSDTQNVIIQPNSDLIVMKKNRDFSFSGEVQAGLFKFYAREGSFEYDKFQLNFAYIDSISFLVRTRETNKISDKQRFTKVRNVLANLTGNLNIDDPNNKSGLKKLSHFPIFESKGESYVYFDKKVTQGGLLKKDSFYYVVEPFIIDSLMSFSTDELKFEGYLTSAGIFPIFTEPLTVMEDYSLGFNHKTNEDGYRMYGDKAKYFDFIHLSDKGFFGNGRIDYLTSTVKSDTFSLYPDSVISFAHEFTMKEKNTVVEFPRGQADSISFRWLTDTNMVTLTTIKKPYIVFNNAIVEGNLTVSPEGMTGSGRISFSNAEIISDSIWFLSQSIFADTADFHLYTVEGKQEAFAALGYQAAIDFEARTGNFKFMGSDCQMSFPFNKYICSLDEADWVMDNDLLKLNNNKMQKKYDLDKLKIDQIIDLDLSGSDFVSTHPLQDSLSFFCLEADYDLVNYTINARHVKIIKVADAAIFPNDGLVTIGKNAGMDTLKSATIITDLKSRYHRITDALVTIESRKKFDATGKYTLIDMDHKPQEFVFQTITVDSLGQTVAYAEIYESQPVSLGNYFDLIGKITMNSTQQLLHFSGGFRINESCSPGIKPFIRFDANINPANVRIPVSKPTDILGNKLECGLYWGAVSDSYHAGFLQYPQSVGDKPVLEKSGILYYDDDSDSFKIEGIDGETNQGMLSMKTNRCIISGEGRFDFENNMQFVDMQTYGDFEYQMIPDSTRVRLFIALNFDFDKSVMSVMADSLNAANLKGVNLSEGNYISAVSQIVNQEEVNKVINDISLYGYPRKLPDELQKTIVISDVTMVYNHETNTFVSKGQIGIGNLYDASINKYVNGYVEFEKGKLSGGFKIYLQPNPEQWFYFDYKSGLLQAISSSNQFNTELMSIKQEKRIKIDKETGNQYEFVISTRRKAIEFLRSMQGEPE